MFRKREISHHGEATFLARNEGRHVATLLIDVDRFSVLIDVYGLPVALSALDLLERRMARRVRNDDVVRRVGSNRFSMTCRVERPLDAVAIGERLRAGAEEPVVVGADRLHLTISVGVAVAARSIAWTDPSFGQQVAHAALHQAKLLGRNRVLLG